MPVAWALQNRKTTKAYVLVLRQFALWTAHIDLKEIYSDFDPAQLKAINQVYPQVRIVRCYFHFIQVSFFIYLFEKKKI